MVNREWSFASFDDQQRNISDVHSGHHLGLDLA